MFDLRECHVERLLGCVDSTYMIPLAVRRRGIHIKITASVPV